MDYAEQIRYEHNVIVPPLLAGTLQCTRDKVDGGDFFVSLDGIRHYREHGYKCKKRALDVDRDPSLRRVPFQFNQLTCHRGHLPHGSTRVEAIHGDQLRVIVGFNVFCAESGPRVREAPEHSDAFRRKVAASRALSARGGVDLRAVRHNRPLAKLLVWAKRARVKEELRRARDGLGRELPSLLPATVRELVARFCLPSDGSAEGGDDDTGGAYVWPYSVDDLRVHLGAQIEEGHYAIVSNGEVNDHIGTTERTVSDGLIPLDATVDLAI